MLKNKSTLFKIIIAVGVVILIVSLVLIVLGIKKKKTTTQSSVTTNAVVESYKQQLDSLSKEAEDKKDDPNAQRNYGVALYATGDLQNAYNQYQKAIKLNGNDAVLYNNFGNIARDLSKYDEAISSYQKAISINSKNINSYVNLANLYIYTLDKADLAIAVYENGLKENPENVDLKIQLAIAYEQKSESAKAKAIYEEILKADSGNAAATAGLNRLKDIK